MATATTTAPRTRGEPVSRPDGFRAVGTPTSPGYNTPQRVGRLLWAPMLLMAFTGWTIGFILAIVEAATDRGDAGTLQDLGHLVPAFMFIGFLGVFSAITFTVARILGAFRKGGGEVQELTGSQVQTLRMPATAKAMLGLMMMGMMALVAGIVVDIVGAAAYDGVTPSDITDSASLAAVASGLRRLGVAFYLTGIAFGLATIVEVLRFQATRIREVAAARGHSH